MRNARYDGCKMTSADFNVDSPDTIDKGPVVRVTVGGGKQLAVRPSVRGNLQIKQELQINAYLYIKTITNGILR